MRPCPICESKDIVMRYATGSTTALVLECQRCKSTGPRRSEQSLAMKAWEEVSPADLQPSEGFLLKGILAALWSIDERLGKAYVGAVDGGIFKEPT